MNGDGSITPLFKLVFLSVLGLSILCLVANVVLAVQIERPSAQVRDVLSTLSTAWKTGFGAIVGLIGGKAV